MGKTSDNAVKLLVFLTYVIYASFAELIDLSSAPIKGDPHEKNYIP